MHKSFFPAVGALLLCTMTLAASIRAQSPAGQDAQSTQTGAAAGASADKPKDGQDTTPPKKVYTNDDLKGMSREDVSVVGNANGQKKTPTNSTTKSTQKDQAYWHNRAQNLRNQIADVDRQIAEITAGSSQTTTTEGSTNSALGSNPIYLHGQGGRLNNLEARKKALLKQMEDLEEEARKAGVPPGWLR